MHILITAGPTREPIDSVRFISNRSSGKLGLALAREADAAGYEVTLLLGPGALKDEEPTYASDRSATYRFESCAELQQLLEAHFRGCDVLIMAAAVADYRPATVYDGKLPRKAGEPLVLRLQATPDLVGMMAKLKGPKQRIIAFALEEEAVLEQRATEKMKRKGVDAIVANPLGTMESEGITSVWLTADGTREAPGSMSKPAFARWLIRKAQAMWGG